MSRGSWAGNQANWARIAARGLGVAALALITVLLAPAPASACAVSYEYRPKLDITLGHSDAGLNQQCSNATSLGGSAALALLATAVLITVAAAQLRRGEAEAERLGAGGVAQPSGPSEASHPSGLSGAELTLSSYLAATGLTSGRPPASGPPASGPPASGPPAAP